MKFVKVKGQEVPVETPWPSFNQGWRLGVVIGAAVVLHLIGSIILIGALL